MKYAWIDIGDGRSVYRRIDDRPVKRSGLPAPMIVTDHMEPVQSMADGKVYDSKSAIRKTYRSSGNPQGVEYIEVGNDPARLKPKTKAKPDRKSIRDAVRKAAAQVNSGVRPQTSP